MQILSVKPKLIIVPLVEYAPSDSNLKKQQEIHQIEWENLVTEILERIK